MSGCHAVGEYFSKQLVHKPRNQTSGNARALQNDLDSFISQSGIGRAGLWASIAPITK